MDTTERVSAVDRLAALDAAMTPGPWVTGEGMDSCSVKEDAERGKPFAWTIATVNLDERDAEGIATLRSALPEIVALLRAADLDRDCEEHENCCCYEWCDACAMAMGNRRLYRQARAALESKVAK